MKIKIKDKKGNVVRQKECRNLLHFEIQKNTRTNIIQSKKTYNRNKIKQKLLKDSF